MMQFDNFLSATFVLQSPDFFTHTQKKAFVTAAEYFRIWHVFKNCHMGNVVYSSCTMTKHCSFVNKLSSSNYQKPSYT